MRYSAPVNTRFAHPRRPADALPVQPGLAVTPAQMLEMANAGIPISSVSMESMYDDGQRTVAFEPPLERQRRVELGDLWENEMDIRKKTRKLFKMEDAAQQNE